jgi:hypothetical protein
VQKRLEVDLALIGHDEVLLRDLEGALVTTAKPHEARTLDWLQIVPGIGQRLSLVLWYDMHDVARFPRGQALVSYGRWVNCAKEAAGQRYGNSGTKLGHASLTWAFSDAAVLFLRNHPAGQTSRVR